MIYFNLQIISILHTIYKNINKQLEKSASGKIKRKDAGSQGHKDFITRRQPFLFSLRPCVSALIFNSFAAWRLCVDPLMLGLSTVSPRKDLVALFRFLSLYFCSLERCLYHLYA
jgi:hypothetical protein